MNRIIKPLLVASGLFAGPGVIFLLPYVVPRDSYAAFAKVLTISQLLAVCGGLGLEIGGPRLNFPIGKLTGLVVVTTMLAAIVVFGISPTLGLPEAVIAIVVGAVTSLATIYQSYSLFKGDAVNYAFQGFFRSATTLIVMAIFLKIGEQASVAWGLGSLMGFVASLWFLKGTTREVGYFGGRTSVAQLLIFSFPFFLINSAAVLPFIVDRFVSQRNLNIDDFSKYMVVTTWAVPIIYLGNFFQQYMVSRLGDESLRKLLKKMMFLLLLGAGYIFFVILVAGVLIPLPYFHNKSEFISIFSLVAGWYAIYSSVAFPAAAYVQREMPASTARLMAWCTAGMFPIAAICAYLFASIWWGKIGMYAAVMFSGAFSSLMIGPRIYFVGRSLSKSAL